MNAQFQVAQLSGSPASGSTAAPTRIFRLSKPLGDQAVVVNLGYDQKAKVDFSAIANEKITLVHVGDKLIVLFDNKSTVTVEPFFDSRHDALGNLSVEVAPGREVSVNEFASLFPITTDQSVLPAAGEGGGNAQATGAYFNNSVVDPLASRNPLDLLGQEELGNFRVNFDTAALTVNGVPQALANGAVVFDEDGLKGGLLGGIGDLDPGSNGPISASGILAHSYGSDGAGTTLLLLGTPPAGFIYTLSADRTVLTVSQFQNGVPVDVVRISLSNTTDGAYTIEQLHAIDHSAGNNENDQTFTFAYEVRDSNGDTAQGSLNLTVDDDSPEVGENASIVFDEDALAFGNLGGIGDVDPATNGPISASGTLAHSYGADGAGTTLLTATGAPEGFTYAVNGTGTVLTVSQMQDGVNVTVLQVVLTDRISGNYTVTQLHAINHASGQDENNQSFTFNYNVTDHDGDATGGTLTLTVNDDTPIALSGSGGEGNQEGSGSFTFATVYEDGLTNLNSGNQSVGNAEGGFQTTSVVITASDLLGLVSFGADQPGTFSLNPGASAPTLFSHGDPVTYSVANGTLTASAGGRTVFTLHDNGDQTFTFVLKDQLDHNGSGDYETLTINLASAFVATDSDGDSVVLNGTFNIRVENDVPVQNYSATVSGSVQEDALTNANSNYHSVGNPEGSGQTTVAEGELSALVKVGADETGTFSLDSAPDGLPSLTSKGATVLYTVSGDTLTGYVEGGGGGGYQAGSDRAVFTLQITPGGHYKFTLLDQVDHLPNSPANNDSQTLTLNFGSAIKFTDADGDSITLSGGLSISVEDDVPVLTGASIARTVDEDDINTAWSQGTSPSDGSGDGSLTEGSTGAAIVTGSLAGLVSTGADESGTFAFSADAIAKLNALGLFSKQTAQGDGENGKPLFYQTSSGGPNEIVITGYEPNPHGNPVLSLTLNTVTGAYEFRLFDELIHVAGDGQNDDLRSGLPVDGIQASVPNIDFGSIITFTDRDGDQATLSGKFTVTITDDVPHADIDIGRGSVTIDETPGNQADDTTSSSVRNLFANLEAALVNGERLVGDDPDVSGDNNGGNPGNGAIAYAHSNFAVVVDNSAIGSDSPPYPHQFTLSVTNGNGTASGLFVTDGSPINLSMRDGLVIGTVVGGQFNGKVAFAIAIGSDGEVSVAQYLSIKHDDRGDSNESNDNGSNNNDASPDDPVTIQQTLDGKITATLTVTDSDGDQSSNSVNIGNLITFLDDGPSVEVKVVRDAHLIHDETPGIDASDDDVAGTTAFAGSTLATVFSAVDTPRGDDPHVTDNPIGYALTNGTVFSFTTQNYGADGAAAVKPVQYELVLSSNNVHSGLQTTDGRDIHLFKEGNLIVGRYEVGGNNNPDGSSDEVAAFAISIDPATGQLAMVQYVSLHHPNDGNSDDTVQLDDGTLSVKVTLTDGDGDPASDTVDISCVVQFEDDGPTLVGSATLSIAVDEDGLATGNADAGRVGEALGTGSAVASGAAGALNALVNFGADGPGSAAFSLAIQSSPVSTGLESKGGDVFIVSDGTTLRGYVNIGGNPGYQAGTDREVFTLTVGSNGSYTFTLKDQIDHPSLNGLTGDNAENLLSGSIDLSKYIVATDGDGDSVKLGNGTFVVQIRDDIPIQTSGSVSGTVEEDDLNNAYSVGNNEDGSSGKTVASGSLTSLVKVGADESGTFAFDSNGITALQGQNLTSHGTTLTYSISGDTLTAKAGAVTVFTLQIQSNGSYTFTLKDQIDHASGNGENTLNINLSSVVRFTDFDSDSVTLSGGFSIIVQDDVPVAKSGTVNLGAVYEDGLTAVNSVGQSVGNPEAGHTAVTATITAAQLATLVSVGTDEPLTFSLNALVGNPAGLTSHGDPVTYSVVGNTLTASAGGTTVFTIVDNGNQTFTFTLKDQIDHLPNTPANDDAQTLILNLASAFKATDYDGDSVVLGGSLNIAIEDDVPTTASNTLVTVDEDDLAAGNHDAAAGDDVTAVSPVTGTLQFSVGADNPATVSFASLNGTAVLNSSGIAVTAAGVALVYLWDSSTNTLYATPDGTPAHAAFQIQVTNTATGAYSFSLLGPVDHPGHDADGLNNGPETAYEDNININLTYTVTDRDGDFKTGTLSVSIDDDVPVLAQAPSNLIVNGDFSQGDFTPEFWGGSASASGSVTGWVFSNSTVDPPANLQVERVNDGYLGMYSSTNGSMIDMGASPGNIQISQQVSGLTAGQTYAIQFEAGAPYAATAKLEVIWNNVVIGTIDPTGPMTSYSYVVTATGIAANDQITFREVASPKPDLGDGGNHGTYLANVAIVATAVVDEDGLTGPLSVGGHDVQIGDAADTNADGDGNEATATGNLNVKWGADIADTADSTGALGAFVQDAPGGAGNRSLTFTDANVTVAGGVPLTSHGYAVSFMLSADATVLCGTTADGRTVFRVSLSDDGSGKFRFVLLGQLDHAPNGSENDISLSFNYTATDSDGDAASGKFVVSVDDDMPTAVAGAALTVLETDGATTGINLLANDTKGADGATVTAVDFGLGGGFQAIAAIGTTTITNVNGTYTFQADGAWTFDPSVNASNSNTTGNFTYRITDGDGDTSTAAQVVNITNANSAPTAGSQSITVDEDGLPNGIATPQSGDIAGNAITQTGTLIHNFNGDGPAASDPINFSPMDNGSHATLVGLSSGGVALKYFWDAAGDTLYASTNTLTLANAQSTAAFKVELNTATGAYTYTQLKPVDHPGHDADGANNGPETSFEDNLNVNLTYQVKDSNNDAVTGTLSVTINDDSPAAAPIVKTVTEGASDTNILLILDRSGSMAFDPGVSGYATRLDLLKAAANELLDQYDAAGDVRVQIIKFNDNAQKQGSVWLSVADAKTYINGLTADNGTDYDDATALAPDAFDDPGKLTTPGVRNVSYFISDGQPEPTSEQVSGSELTDWINFVNANDIVSYAIGLGSSAPDTYLDPLAHDGRGTGAGTDTDALIVTDLNQLQSTLVGTINPSISGSVIDGSIPTSFGADGGYVKSIAIGGKTYSYNPTTDQITETGSGQNGYSFNTANNKLTITFAGSAGESFVIDLDDGTYVYTPPTNIAADFSRPFTYTLTDNDGDTVSSTLTINIDNVNGAPVLDANASPFLVAISEDAVAPSGPVGTLVSSLVDLTGGGGINNVTDADGPGLGIAITGTNSANGTWFYSTNNGTTWTAVGAVGNSSALLLEADGSTRLYFQPAANYSGTVTDGITFRAWDETTGTAGTKVDTSSNGGSSAFSSATDTASVTVNAVNDAPTATITPASYSATEQTNLTLHGTGLSIGDVADGNTGSMTVTLSVGVGILTFTAGNSGATIGAGNGTASVTITGTVTQINNLLGGVDTGSGSAGTIIYNANTDAPSANTTLTLTVNDNGNVGGGSITGSDTAQINISALNDAPVVSGISVNPATGQISFSSADPDSNSFTLVNTPAGIAGAFGNPTLALGANTLAAPVVPGSVISGTLQIKDSLGATDDVIGVYLGTNSDNTNITLPLAGALNAVYAFGGTDTINLTNGGFTTGTYIDGGAGNDTINLTTTGDGTSLDFSVGTIVNIENLASVDGGSGSSYDQTFSVTAAQWAGLSSIDMNDGSDTLNIRVNGAVDISSAGAATVADTETVNVSGTGAADSLTLTGAQLNTLITGGAGIDLGGGSDTVNLKSTSAGLNGLSDGRLVNVEAVSASTAAAGVTINLGNQTEVINITGSSQGDIITAATGGGTVNAGLGADTVTISASNLTDRSWTVDLGNDAAADKIVFSHAGLNGSDNTVATVSNFHVAEDKIAVTFNGAAIADGAFQAITSANPIITAGTEVIEIAINNAAFVTTSLTDASNSGAIEDIIAAATNGIPTGNYTFIVYSNTTGTADAGIYTVNITDSTDPGSNGMTVEHTMTLNGVGFGNLKDSNFVATADPIVLDLDQNGVAFSSLENGVSFDINADGASDQVAWTVNGQDGILALDVDGSGKIEGGKELFTPNFNGGQFADGIAALASLDGNHDGVIDSQDQAFGELVVWQDANHNGVSETSELAKLGDLGITSISLTTTQGGAPIDGQHIAGTGSFTYADGSTGTFVEVDLDASLGKASAQPDSHPAEDHDLTAFAAVAAEIEYGGGDIDLSGLQQPGADHAPAPQAQGAEVAHAGVDAGATTPAAITIMHEQAALAMQLAAS